VVPGVSPVIATECAVTRAALRAESDPYAVVVPYPTCELEGRSVVQVTMAVVVVMPVAATALIVGIVAVVENVKFPDIAVPAASTEIAA
jgi:hypothetical protein